MGPFANQRDLDAASNATGRHTAEKCVIYLAELPRDHDTPTKAMVVSAGQQLETVSSY